MELHLFMYPFSTLKSRGAWMSENEREGSLLETQAAYNKGLENARGKLLCVFRASPLDVVLREEKELYQNIRKTCWNASVHISPEIGEKNVTEEKQNLAIEQFLARHFSSPERRALVDIYIFGDPLSILPECAKLFQRDFGIKTNPHIYVPGCQKNPQELCKLLDRYREMDYILG